MSRNLYKELKEMRQVLMDKYNDNDICNDYFLRKLAENKPINYQEFNKIDKKNQIEYEYVDYFLAVINKRNYEQLAMSENTFQFDFSLPYKIVYRGIKINAYAKNFKSKPYICSCYKEAIKNRIKMYEYSLQYDFQIKDRDKLLLEELGLPKCFENKILASGMQWSEKWIDLIDFKDNLCPVCNNLKCQEPRVYLQNGTSQFKQRYEKEIDRRFFTYGINDEMLPYYGYCWLEECLPDNLKNILNTDYDELKSELLQYYSKNELDALFNMLKKLPKEIQENLIFARGFSKSGRFRYYEYFEEHKIDDKFQNFISEINKIISEKYKQAKKVIIQEVKDYDKKANENKSYVKLSNIHFYIETGKKVTIYFYYNGILLVESIDEKKEKLNKYKFGIDTYANLSEFFNKEDIKDIKIKKSYCKYKWYSEIDDTTYSGDSYTRATDNILKFLDDNVCNDGKIKELFLLNDKK